MKNGTHYAAQLQKTYAQLRKSVSIGSIPEPDDPIQRLCMAVLGETLTETQGRAAYEAAMGKMVDVNELRVSTPGEIRDAVGSAAPVTTQQCRQLVKVLQAVFDRENKLSLDRLRSLGRRDAKQYFDDLSGIDPYVTASIVLWSLGGHAVPVNDTLLEKLRAAGLVDENATRGEVQAFLERHVAAAEAKEFCVVMESFAGPGKRKGTGKGTEKRTGKTAAKAKSARKTKKKSTKATATKKTKAKSATTASSKKAAKTTSKKKKKTKA